MIAGFDAIATGTDIQRRIGVKTSRDEPLARFTTMRVGGPADLFATVHNAHELRALVRFARTRGTAASRPGAGERPGHRRRRDPRPGHPGPGRGLADRRRALHGRGRRADGPRRDRDPARRPDRARVRAGDPGHGRRRRLGQRRRPRGRHRGASSSRPASSPPTARRRSSRPPSSGFATATAGSRRPATGAAGDPARRRRRGDLPARRPRTPT